MHSVLACYRPLAVGKRLNKAIELNLYCSPNIMMIKSRIIFEGHRASTLEIRIAYKHFVGNPEGKKQPAGPKHRWNCNIEIFIKKIVWV
jgi:hypothetical protein